VNTLAPATPIEVWFQDEMRVGQKNGQVYQWAKKGTRPRQPKDQRYENAYLFGAVCPGRNTGIAAIMPHADTEAMQKHVDEINFGQPTLTMTEHIAGIFTCGRTSTRLGTPLKEAWSSVRADLQTAFLTCTLNDGETSRTMPAKVS
jgi:hypothetical protein